MKTIRTTDDLDNHIRVASGRFRYEAQPDADANVSRGRRSGAAER